ncbi:MAG TPA: response regulator [Lacunisphaera sp.]
MKILIIEDEPAIRETLQELLELNGHTVRAAADGRRGVELARDCPELILCDVGLPGLDGYQVIAEVQKLPQCRDIPFIFLTARAEREDQRRGMALGADDYITKPFTERDIVDAINARVRRQQPLRERLEQLLAERSTVIGANWSHELMTPLNGVLGGLEMIEEEAESIQPGELRELLGLIRTGAERQQALSNKLMLYYELERLLAAADRAPAPFISALEAVKDGASQAARQEDRAADVMIDCAPVRLAVFASHLQRAVAELVANACRFSRPGQRVVVSGRLRERRYLLEVADEGPGITPDQCARIGPFVQFGREKREQQGLGLGLAIARSVARLAGGRLVLEPRTDGPGLRVTLDLPGQPA